MQQHVVRSHLLEMSDARANLQLACHPRRADEWLAGGRQLTDQGVIGEVSRCNLESLHAPLVQLVQAGFIPGGAEGH